MINLQRFSFIVLFATLILAGCSSKQKAADSDESAAAADISPSGVTLRDDGDSDAPKNSTSKPAKKTDATQNEILTQAIQSGNVEQIQNSSQLILKDNPGDYRALNAMGIISSQKGKQNLAVYYFSKALEARPNGAEALGNLGTLELSRNETRKGIQFLRKSIAQPSGNARAAATLGSFYIKQKDYHKAATVLEMAYQKGMRDSAVTNNYGAALMGIGANDKALEVLKTSLKANPNQKEALLNISILLIENMKKPSEGLEYLNKLKFMGGGPESRNRINILENKANPGLK